MHIPKEIDAAVKERALRMFADHRQDDPSDTALAEAVANKVGVGRETARRWLVQADVNAGALPGASSDEQAEIKRLKAEVKKLREDNEILKAATVFFAGELDPRGRVLHHRPPDARPGHERSPPRKAAADHDPGPRRAACQGPAGPGLHRTGTQRDRAGALLPGSVGPRGDLAAVLGEHPAGRLDRVAGRSHVVDERRDQRLRGTGP